jgi:YD repeat-containing protein
MSAETFKPSGQLASITDRNGYTTTLAYNSAGQLATVTDPAGNRTNATDPTGLSWWNPFSWSADDWINAGLVTGDMPKKSSPTAPPPPSSPKKTKPS